MAAIICLLISHILLELVISSSDTHHSCAAEPGGDIWVDGDVSGHVACPEPVHAVQHAHLSSVTPGIDVEEDEVLEDLAAAGGVAFHELHLLDLEQQSGTVLFIV